MNTKKIRKLNKKRDELKKEVMDKDEIIKEGFIEYLIDGFTCPIITGKRDKKWGKLNGKRTIKNII